MPDPRKRPKRESSQTKRGQVVDLKVYQNQRKKRLNKGKRPDYVLQVQQNVYLRVLCIAIASVTAILAICGLIPSALQIKFLLWGMLSATVGLTVGLVLHVVQDRFSRRVLQLEAALFAFTCLCALLYFII